MQIVSVSEMRELERLAIESGVTAVELMDEAGSGAADWIYHWSKRLPEIFRRRFVVVIGRGNNGGDGLKVALDLLEKYHCNVVIYSVAPIYKMSDTSRQFGQRMKTYDITELKFKHGDIIIDALLGIGLVGALNPPYDMAIRKINQSNLPVISLDIPSGLNGDNGIVNPEAVRATFTISFGYPKQGLVMGKSCEYTGPIRLVKISVPPPEESPFSLVTGIDIRKFLKALPHDSHKNSRGRVAVIGGNSIYQGAPQLAATAALRSGAGLVQLTIAPNVVPQVPLAMVLRPMDESFTGSLAMVQDSDVSVIGPGWLGEFSELLGEILATDKTLVLDAEALNLIAANPELIKKRPANATTVMTPHPGEIRRLQEAFNLNPELHRNEQAAKLAVATNCYIALKGAKTVIAAPDGRVAINSSGSPALATAGSGDVLTGVIAAMLCKKPVEEHFMAVCAGVYIHGLAGELHPHAQRSIIGDDLPELIQVALRYISPLA